MRFTFAKALSLLFSAELLSPFQQLLVFFPILMLIVAGGDDFSSRDPTASLTPCPRNEQHLNPVMTSKQLKAQIVSLRRLGL